MKKIRVGILCGGKSAEHEISLRSAKNVIDALDKKKYEAIIIGIDQQGKWFLQDQSKLIQQAEKLQPLGYSGKQVSYAFDNAKELVAFSETGPHISLDVVFPVLHGPYGEDGTVQGFLKLTGVPFVGASILGSAVGMDKDVMKRLLRDAGIPVAKFLVFHDYEQKKVQFDQLKKQLGLPFFVKPANLGSSIGVTKVHSEKEFKKAITIAFSYDTKIVCEETIIGREIECSILGNDHMIASLPGEIIAHDGFYSYNAKYLDAEVADLQIPAKLSPRLVREVQKLAIKTAQTLCVEGMGRVDCFLTEKGKIYVNEINTIPGFTAISMYPKMWKASGVSYSQLVDRLVQLAIERYKKEKQLKTTI